MATASTFISDSDLHGLVDGFVDAGRRTDLLRRLAGSPSDRGRLDAWQGHNDLLRNAFSSVVGEPLPIMLDLSARPQLHCVPANDGPLAPPETNDSATRQDKRGLGAVFATILVVAAGLGGSWIMLDADQVADPIAGAKLRGSVDATLATRSLDALSGPPGASGASPAVDLPTTDIPDLHGTGFSFAGAETTGGEPASVQFRYSNATSDRLVVSVARSAPGTGTMRAPVRLGQTYGWHQNGLSYAIAGTVRPQRLQAIAVALAGESN